MRSPQFPPILRVMWDRGFTATNVWEFLRFPSPGALGAATKVTDGHKWLMAPKGSGALWASRSLQDILEPVIISSDNAPSTKFQDRFDYIGTRDYTSWCAMGAALDFRDMLGGLDTMHMAFSTSMFLIRNLLVLNFLRKCFQTSSYHNHLGLNDDSTLISSSHHVSSSRSKHLSQGGEKILQSYTSELTQWAGQMMSKAFGTETVVPSSMTPSMFAVRLPIPLRWQSAAQAACAGLIAGGLINKSMQVISFPVHQDLENMTHWIRVSSQIYLDHADFHALTEAIVTLGRSCRDGADIVGVVVWSKKCLLISCRLFGPHDGTSRFLLTWNWGSQVFSQFLKTCHTKFLGI